MTRIIAGARHRRTTRGKDDYDSMMVPILLLTLNCVYFQVESDSHTSPPAQPATHGPRTTAHGTARQDIIQQSANRKQSISMKFRPCIDLHSGQVKQIVGSTLVDDKKNALAAKSDSAPAENFATDKPAKEYAEMYKRDGLTGGHVIMLGPGNQEAVSSCGYILMAFLVVYLQCHFLDVMVVLLKRLI